jgi:protein disulfide-isomerase
MIRRTSFLASLPLALLALSASSYLTPSHLLPSALARNFQEEIQWEEDLDLAMRRAANSGKPVLIHFYGDNCPPCRMLEKKAFRDPQLIDALNSQVIPVRINAERDLKTALRMRVNRWPTDVYLFPNGDEIYRNVSNQDPAVYEKIVAKVAEKNTQRSSKSNANPIPSTQTIPNALANKTAPRPQTASSLASFPSAESAPQNTTNANPSEPARIRLSESTLNSVDTAEVTVAQPPKRTPTNTPSENLPTNVAMQGHCPVSLRLAIDAAKSGQPATPAWVQGSEEFSTQHRGRTYLFASAQARDSFLNSPDHFAPILSGCDLIEFSKSGKWIDGDCRFGFIEQKSGRIFLFSSSLNCEEFARNCEAYSNMVGNTNSNP